MNVTKDTIIGDLLQHDKREDIASVLMNAGMHCLGCSIAKHETIAQAAEVHGLDTNELVKKIKAVIE